MQRYPDWPRRLRLAIEERRNLPHAWGSNDCALYAADLVAAMTGVDLGEAFRGRYSDAAGAEAELARRGWADLSGVADAFLPRRLERPRRGDVVLQPGRFGPFLGIVWNGEVIGAGVLRPTLWPLRETIACWSVG